MSTADEVNAAVAHLLPASCVSVVAAAPVPIAMQALTSLEKQGTQGFSALRMAEYAEGRFVAKMALKKLAGRSDDGVGRIAHGEAGYRGAPLWPNGIVGSISHSSSFRGAAVAWADDVISLGIDIEQSLHLPQGAAEVVLSEAERRGRSAVEQVVKFSAKESLYKVWAPLMRCWLGFEQVEVMIKPDINPEPTLGAVHFGNLEYRLDSPQALQFAERIGLHGYESVTGQLFGRYAIGADFLATAAWLNHSEI